MSYKSLSNLALIAEVERLFPLGEPAPWELVRELGRRVEMQGPQFGVDGVVMAVGLLPVRRRVLVAQRMIEQQQAATVALAAVRREAIGELLAGGMNQSQVADLLGVSRSAVSKAMADEDAGGTGP